MPPFTISQDLFLNDATTFTVVKCQDDAMGEKHLQPLLDTVLAHGTLGISATYDNACRLSSIAFATLSQVLVVNISKSARHNSQDTRQRHVTRNKRLLQDRLLLNNDFHKYAFTMDQLAAALHFDLSVCISNAVDMISVTTDGRHSLEALMNAMGGEVELNKKNVRSLFFDHSGSSTVKAPFNVALKAWAACKAATLPHMSSRFASLPRIDTTVFPTAHLDALTSIVRNADRLEALKPVAVKNDVQKQFTMKKDSVDLFCDRFPTRIKRSSHQVIRIEIEGNNTITGRTRRVSGRRAQINVNQAVKGNKVISVTTIGKDDPTSADSARQDIVLGTLQGRTNIFSNPFFQALWLPNERRRWPERQGQTSSPPVHFSRRLNPSQRTAVERILSDKDNDRIIVIQGPPGTGKTTVIAASVISHDHAKSSQKIWVAAHSNVAVKNIAEKFIKEGFLKFKLLVSKDFHFDWHEHLYEDYEDLQQCLIRSDNFPKSIVAASRLLCGCEVILCTLSMFSHPYVGLFLRVVPVEMLILDEASQIECGEYLPIFHRFHLTLSKLVFIGDDKQLPPYGQEEIQKLRSVFEFNHLRRRALFLGIQYRMPHIIANFISQNVYDNKLSTCHSFTSSRACLFIDVSKGRETKKGCSWINEEEARVVVKIAGLYESKSFRIITPYDAQRTLIENMLKSEKLPWEDKVFNVDSFQGNEDDYIIVSVVRSNEPGFLKNRRRNNVMLTRCKQGMVICSSRAFLFGKASKTLVGKLAAYVGEQNWLNGRDVFQVGARI